MRQQFFQRQTQLGRMAPGTDEFQRRIRRRRMQIRERFHQCHRIVGFARQQIRHRVGGEFPHRLLAQLAPCVLGDARRGRIHRRQCRVQGRGLPAEMPVVRMIQFKPARPQPRLPVAPQAPAGDELILLRRREMKEAQAELPRAVANPAQQAAAAVAAVGDVRQEDAPLHHRLRAFAQGADGGDAGAVLIAQGKVEQQILHLLYSRVREFGGDARAHAAQSGDRAGGEVAHSAIIISTSIAAPLGSAAT